MIDRVILLGLLFIVNVKAVLHKQIIPSVSKEETGGISRTQENGTYKTPEDEKRDLKLGEIRGRKKLESVDAEGRKKQDAQQQNSANIDTEENRKLKKTKKKTKAPTAKKAKKSKKKKSKKENSTKCVTQPTPVIPFCVDISQIPGPFFTSNGALTGSDVDKLIDGDKNTDFVSNSASPLITLTYPNSKRYLVEKYSFRSSATNINPDPTTWSLEGSNDDGVTWVEIDRVRNFKFTKRKQVASWDVKSPGLYGNYRVKFKPNSGPIAFAEYTFCGTEGYSIGVRFLDELVWSCGTTKPITEENKEEFEDQVLEFLNFFADCAVDERSQLEYFDFTLDTGICTLEMVDTNRGLQSGGSGNGNGQCIGPPNCPGPGVTLDRRHRHLNTERILPRLTCDEFNDLEFPEPEFIDLFGKCNIRRKRIIETVYFTLAPSSSPSITVQPSTSGSSFRPT